MSDEVVDLSTIALIDKLKIGDAFTLTEVVKAPDVNIENVLAARQKLRNRIGPMMVRVKARKPGCSYTTHGAMNFCRNLDVIVTLAVQRLEDDPFYIPAEMLENAG